MRENGSPDVHSGDAIMDYLYGNPLICKFASALISLVGFRETIEVTVNSVYVYLCVDVLHV